MGGDSEPSLVAGRPSARRAHAGQFYSEHAELAESLYRQYTKEQIELLLDFVQRGREFNERKAAELERRLQERALRD